MTQNQNNYFSKSTQFPNLNYLCIVKCTLIDKYIVNQRAAEMTNNFKIDENNDPRQEVKLLEESCEVN